ncbi:Putative ribulose-1,5-bisphosphate carboxylase, Type III [Lunatimonas lonarensis]|uniref:Putative ribulose-1,5-bisphosphate carboxylase, Type III n=1 Tax=Lunatimonas lonarensis TaxID=1232681 RepID=R7ZRC1_9BACT|nr:ribulose-bisphosphate carboxylase large subunit family protein [Lunatimonas lonarensis]EON76670.1 Putative ribulose-1,5-bisphosphate carboxylase, Type III [Lunatimonas lonarensis]
MSERFSASYLIETSQSLEKAVQTMAGEQSTGTFVKIPGETGELMEKYAAKIEELEELETVDQPALPHAKKGTPIRRARVKLSWPVENIGPNLPNLMATVAGNLFELAPFSGLKLLDIRLPDSFESVYPGPGFGIGGTYKKIGISDRPIIGTIIKPSVGLDAALTAKQVSTLIDAGLDFIKDDELMGDPTYNRFTERVDACMKVINNYADKHGKKPMYAFNLSGTMDEMKKRHDYLLEKGGTCIMINLIWVGLSGIQEMAGHTQLPIHGHRNGWGIFQRHPLLGIEYPAMAKMWRLAGVDHLHCNGIRNKFCETDDSVFASIKDCLTPIWSDQDRAMPVLSSGQWAGQAFDTYKGIQSTTLMYLAGGGIMGHPGGIAAGVESLRYAWQAAMEGLDEQAARERYKVVDEAFEFFG